MHSHDRTLLASLGFQDKDRKDPRHSLACQYLARPEVAMKVWKRLVEPEVFGPLPEAPKETKRADQIPRMAREAIVLPPQHEVQITKGDGKYRTTVGFWDVVLMLQVRVLHPRMHDDSDTGRVWYQPESISPRWSCSVEVKTNPVDVGDLARQMDLYLEFSGRPQDPWTSSDFRNLYGARFAAVALTWQLHPEEKTVLMQKGIHVLWLGEPFERYCAERANQPAGEPDESPL